MSSACIRVASITVAVIIARLMTPLLAAVPAMSGPEDRGDVTPQLAERALVAGIDRDLDPVAGGILRRQQGKYRSARRRKRRHPAGDGGVRIGVDGDARRIAFSYI